MIVYVDLEHDCLRQNTELWHKSLASQLKTKFRLEEIAGDLCLIVRYQRLTPALLHQLGVRAVIVSGNYTDWEHYAETDLAGLRAVFREAAWPIFSICGGYQIMAQTYGAEIGPMGPLAAGDPEPPPEMNYTPGLRQERGFRPVRIVTSHPLFAGLNSEPVIFQSHYWEVKAPPAGFCVLATSDLCGVQVIANEGGRLFGTQSHPELYDEVHPDGQKILENFFSLAGIRRNGY